MSNLIEKPAIRPPVKHPSGIVKIPAKMPLERYFSSSFLTIPKAIGIENERVVPIEINQQT